MAKKIEGYIKLNIPAGSANPSPPVGPALGQRGVNIMEFCKAFNAATDRWKKQPCASCNHCVSGQIFFFCDEDSACQLLSEKSSWSSSASGEPGRTVAGKVTMAQIREIADAKMGDMNSVNVEGAMQMVIGSARSMGLEVVEG